MQPLQTYSLGACTIHRIEETTMVFPPHGLLKANSKEEARELRHACINTPWIVNTFANEKGHVYLVIQSFIIVTPDNKKIIVLCHHGIRSSKVVNYLIENGFKSVFNLSGGIDKYTLEIDKTLKRY